MLQHGLSCFEPAPGRNDGKIYYFVPENINLDQPAGLLIFMHGGDGNSPDTAPYNTYLNPENGALRPHIDNCQFIVAAASAALVFVITIITLENGITHFSTSWSNYSFGVSMLLIFCVISNI